MKIAVCDDDLNIQQSIVKALKLVYAETGQNWEAPVVLDNAEELLAQLKCGVRFDLLYLDIEMPGLSGIEAAAEIRAMDRQIQIIFVTNHEQYVFDTFRVQPLDFLSKPINCRRFLEAFRRALDNYRLQHQTIACASDGGIRILFVAEMVCVESAGKKVSVTMADGTLYRFNHKLEEMEQRLKVYHLIRCHRSLLVNLAYVREIAPRLSFRPGRRSEGKDVLFGVPFEPNQLQRRAIGEKYLESFQAALMRYQEEGGVIYR